MPCPSYFCHLPLRTSDTAPRFNGTVPTELPFYLENIDLLTTNIGLTDSDKIQVAIRYADRDDAKLWETSSQVHTL
jgi:flagellar basal body-associated protein FliL